MTLGQTDSTNEACAAPNFAEVQFEVADGASYTVPAGGGVITSWQHQARDIDNAMMKLKVFRPAGGTSFMAVGESVFQNVGEPELHSFPVRIPVLAGDRIGLGTAPNAADAPTSCFVRRNVTGDQLFEGPDFAIGTTSNLNSPGAPFKERLNIEAKLEPDADKDNFGDETQDQCPTDASTQGACPTGGGGGGGGSGGGGGGGGGTGVVVPGQADFERGLSLGYSKKDKSFDGEVASDESACLSGKVTVFEKTKGDDDKVGSDRTGSAGEFEVDKRAKPGTYYAEVGESAIAAGTCLGEKSKNEKVR